jgi:hypothetical protein
MSTVATTRAPSFSALRRVDVLLPIMFLLIGLVVYRGAREVFTLASSTPTLATGAVLLALAGAVPFAKLRYGDLPRYIGIFVRWIAVAVFIQALADAVSFAPGLPNLLHDGGTGVIFFRYAAVIAMIAGIIGWWRPAFLVALIGFYMMFRLLLGHVTQIPVVKTDFMSMTDTGLFALLGTLTVIAICGPWTAARIPWIARWHDRVDVSELRKNSTLLIWSCAVGAHLANYFWSGVAKLSSGWPEPWTWLLHNPTQTSILMGLERGDNLLWAFPTILDLIWNAFIYFALPLNAVVLGVQLFAPMAALGRRVLLSFTVFFDLFHVVVWFTLGALFQYWVLVNILIFASAQHLGIKRFTRSMQFVMALSVLVAPRFFYVNHLGWLDGAKLASPVFLAHTRDGRTVNVPGPYFGLFSYNIAQGRLYAPNGAFPNWQAGNHKTLTTWRDAIACGPARAAKQKNYTSLDAVRNMIQRTDAFAREHPWYKRYNTYYYYPHHMLPNPWRFRQFNQLSIDDITSYTYRIDSVCLDLRNGMLHRDVRDRWDYPIPTSIAASSGR